MNEWVNVGERKGEVPGGWGTISWFLHMLIGCQHFLLQSAVRNAFCFITQYSAAYIPVKYGHVHFTYVHNFTYIKKLWNNFYTYYNLSNDLFYPSFFKKKKMLVDSTRLSSSYTYTLQPTVWETGSSRMGFGVRPGLESWLCQLTTCVTIGVFLNFWATSFLFVKHISTL